MAKASVNVADAVKSTYAATQRDKKTIVHTTMACPETSTTPQVPITSSEMIMIVPLTM